jgi:acyl-CoA synthetase (AMP-forming)/AMP-acid ligase II
MPRVFPGVRIFLMYGLTEAFRSTYLDPARFDAKKGSIGRAVPNVETFVVVRGRGLAAPGEEGELVHRGSFISRGYWGRTAETDEKIRTLPELSDILGDEKVVCSGDIVRMDDDGDLWFVGRADGMIKSMGFRISPTEVEDIVHRSGLASQVVAFGVEDDMAGQVVEVCVAHEMKVDPAAIMTHARSSMPHYMVPRRVHVWPGEMPRTASGKIDVPAVVRACMSTNGEQSTE